MFASRRKWGRSLTAVLAFACVFAASGCGTAEKPAATAVEQQGVDPAGLDLGAGADFWMAIESIRQNYELGESLGARSSAGAAMGIAKEPIVSWKAHYGGRDAYADQVASKAIAFANSYAKAARTGRELDLGGASVDLAALNTAIRRWNSHVDPSPEPPDEYCLFLCTS